MTDNTDSAARTLAGRALAVATEQGLSLETPPCPRCGARNALTQDVDDTGRLYNVCLMCGHDTPAGSTLPPSWMANPYADDGRHSRPHPVDSMN